ncbi:MAG TPA: radical SAM protein [Candidatus Lokiarchaeia archaeon]|nr:radical SAM protein [Candidatus Lokiarchaeia archaeon]
MNILYVNAANSGSIGLDSFLRAPPLSLMYLSPTVPDHKKFLLDLKSKPMKDDAIHNIMSKADLVAISSFTPSIKNAIEIARMAKEHNLPVVIGGYHASLIPEVVKDPIFDVAVRREGELTFPELVAALDKDGKWTHNNLKDIQGIAYMKGNDMVQTEPRPLIKDLDTLPMPDRGLIGGTNYEYFGCSVDSLESSRGCVNNCHFCCVTAHCGKKWRRKSPERVVREIAQCHRSARWITYQDSELTIDMKRVRAISDLVIEHGLDKQWYSAQARADDIVKDVETVDRMVESGFRMLFLGIESVHQASLDRIGKNLSEETIRQAVKILHDRGVSIYGAIVIGNLGETFEMVQQTIKYAIDLDLDIVQFTALTPYPGTRLWDEAVAANWIEDSDWTHYDFVRPVMRTAELTRAQIAELVHQAYKSFYLPDNWGGYFWKRAPRFFSQKNYWWFFKMLPDFLKNIPTVYNLVKDISKPAPIEEFTGKV